MDGIFLEAQQLICLFHAKRNWKTKLSSLLEEENAEDAISILSKLTTAMSQEEYNNVLANLYDKPYYKTITQYVSYWLNKREVSAYRQSQLTKKTQYRIVHLNNFVDIDFGTDSQV
mgnify:FL=1